MKDQRLDVDEQIEAIGKALNAHTTAIEQFRLHLALWLIRWTRKSRMARIDRDRREQALVFNRYEFVGGKLDGQTVVLHAVGLTPDYCYGGLYFLKEDGRLHYRQRSLPPID